MYNREWLVKSDTLMRSEPLRSHEDEEKRQLTFCEND